MKQKEKSLVTAYVLWFLLGIFGAHKFYLRKNGMGAIYIFTLGFMGIGCLIDLFTLPVQVKHFNQAFDEIVHGGTSSG